MPSRSSTKAPPQTAHEQAPGAPQGPHVLEAHPPRLRPRASMVRWLHPTQFMRTGLDSMLSALFGARADARLIESVVRPQPPYFDYSQATGEDFWLDYAADTGDGWNSTYAVARLLALPRLELSDPTGRRHVLERGQILVLGGDEVYPGASREVYQERLVGPYEEAMGRTKDENLHLYAIPGNHDWYDGLAAFLRLFCAHRWVAGRRTRQSRSYFALKLPHGWWLLGTDVQLTSDIDVPQVEYFRQVSEHMGPADRVILCNAEPAWLMAATSRRHRGYLENNLEYLQEKVLGRRISLFLAGDLHHYQRHEDSEGRQKIIAGGGGAFLHPTHAPFESQLSEGYAHRAAYPDLATSRRLAWGNLALGVHSPLFGLLTGGLYLVLALAAYTEVARLGLSELPEVVTSVLATVVNRPLSLALGLGLFAVFCSGADEALGRWRAPMGCLHALAHVVGAFFVGWGATHLVTQGLGVCPAADPITSLCEAGWLHTVGKFGLGSLFTFAGGFLLGPLLTGLYFLVSLNVFGAHSNEAFASLASPDWKNFLRLRIDKAGELTVFPVGLERVARHWRPTGEGPYGPQWTPDDPQATEPRLIEPPVPVTPRRLAQVPAPPAPEAGAAGRQQLTA